MKTSVFVVVVVAFLAVVGGQDLSTTEFSPLSTSSTLMPSTTTETTMRTTTKATEKPKTTTPGPFKPSEFRYGYYCTCDLHKDLCDLNCCCEGPCRVGEPLQLRLHTARENNITQLTAAI